MVTCTECDREFKNSSGLSAHKRLKHSQAIPAIAPVDAESFLTGAPKKLPGFSQKVRDNAAQRMMKLARPVCPFSQVEHERGTDGVLRRKDKGPDEQNCQKGGGRWWEACEALGHNPYFRVQKWYTTEDKLEPEVVNGEPTGRLIKVGEVVIPHELTQPNIAQVAINPRINAGMGAVMKIQRDGFKRLGSIGYEEVCQFRNCQKPTVPEATTRKYGAYCGKNHLALIVADVEQEFLNYELPRLNADETEKVARRRAKRVREMLVLAQEVG